MRMIRKKKAWKYPEYHEKELPMKGNEEWVAD